ncbi:hypothetical protein B0I72DRAFT_135100 [Yarrowia lipolytica]|nr:hypothetical protein BKA91DRAFT_141664 [Yarrowia lipolytica]KAE8169318.1 hypothetical protein BKA90DRAFT_142862 [Yarrowia lipolytica]RDW25485.1 hypothetical protein B0I71DRAFT_132486 [Yarrowia lipolytica]RDW34210.1 hypothetical protein B0I72DRAFT_135100 [Yarrowia lipolytica]RDW37590.1 hypothetical protein B0I73DRAFT_135255 [Yarrowia lipolytica]
MTPLLGLLCIVSYRISRAVAAKLEEVPFCYVRLGVKTRVSEVLFWALQGCNGLTGRPNGLEMRVRFQWSFWFSAAMDISRVGRDSPK